VGWRVGTEVREDEDTVYCREQRCEALDKSRATVEELLLMKVLVVW